MENSGLLNWKYVEVFVFDPAISPHSLVLGGGRPYETDGDARRKF